MKNVTITLDEKVAQWAKVWAARNNSSISRLTGELLRQRMLEEEGYRAAMKQFFDRKPVLLKKKGKYPDRDELHER